MEAKIAVIGDRASVMAFRTVGFDIFEAGTDTQISDLIESLADDRYS
ncbi:V-type ATP synthase subunit F, partial [Lentihominibacter sp.]